MNAVTLREWSQARKLVQFGVQQGWIRFPLKLQLQSDSEVRRETTRRCMARLRAEQRGQDTSTFPPRIRKRPQRKRDDGV